VTVAVTGLGAITALGATAQASFDRLAAGDRGFRPLRLFDAAGYRTSLVGQVDDALLPAPAPGAFAAADFSRTSVLAQRAAAAALACAGLDARGPRLGLVVGGTTAGMLETESLLSVLVSPAGEVDEGVRKEALARMLSHPLSAPTDRLARLLDTEDWGLVRVRSLSSACSSGANALVVGALWLELGLVDAVLCGAADALCRVTLGGFGALGALDPDGARPFDLRRRGLTLGEGAGFVVLERADDARARGKAAWCTLLGWSSRSEAHHITNPEPEGAAPAVAMCAALVRAGLTPADVDWVNAHGTGTQLNDPMEARALARALGREVDRVPVSSQKGQIGHTLAAAGAIEAVTSALAIARGVVLPTGGLEHPDPACPLVHVLGEARPAKLRAVLSSSFGFGGMDTVLVLGGPSAEAPPRAPARRVVVTAAAALLPGGLAHGEALARASATPAALAAVPAEVLASLDPERARRLDRTSRLAACVLGEALAESAPAERERDPDLGVVLGSAFGAVDATATFMRRLREKGPRLVSPADFPSLVPSSPAGHVSIYHRLRGPSLVVADLAASGEAAFAQAHELLASGEAFAMAVIGVEERSTIVEQVLAVLFAEARDGAAPDAAVRAPGRGEGASAVILEEALHARSRGARVLAEVADVRAIGDGPEALAWLPPPPPRALVVGDPGARAASLVARSAWRDVVRAPWPEGQGAHEAMGGVAIALAVAALAAGQADAALCAGTARGRGYALVLVRPRDAPG
jgi:3-oxoacyl-[acyl-carrier-protein] synthase II